MKILLFVLLVLSVNADSILIKTTEGFIMKPEIPVSETPTGFLFTGQIIWYNKSPYANMMVFVSESNTRAWEYVSKTDSNGTFRVPIKPNSDFNLYAWDGTSKFYTKYDGHFYYLAEKNNLYQAPTGEDPFIADKGDIIIVDIKGN